MSFTPMWKTGCKAETVLENLLMTGRLNFNVKPKEVYNSHADSKIYKLSTFRTHLNKVKSKLGTALVKVDAKNDVEKTKSEQGQFGGLLTPAKRNFDDTEGDEDYNNKGKYNFCLQSSWEHPETGKKFCDVFIILPSGLQDSECYEINFSECTTKLSMKLI